MNSKAAILTADQQRVLCDKLNRYEDGRQSAAEMFERISEVECLVMDLITDHLIDSVPADDERIVIVKRLQEIAREEPKVLGAALVGIGTVLTSDDE